MGLGATIARRLLAVAVRVVAIAVIVALMGTMIGTLVLPVALATTDAITAVRTDVLDIAPMGEADTPPQNSYVYDAHGRELAELTFEENRVPVTLDQIPQVVIDAVLATEDAQFYSHRGVNHLAIIRAALTNLRAGGIESGASTITQQYVKLAFLTPEQTIQRKIEEAIYALQLEERYTKDQILEMYLNRSLFGGGVYGIGTAAQRYFSKDVGDLSLGEAATLAGILRSPARNNPIASRENARARRDIVLRQMATHGFVTEAQAAAAIDEPLITRISEPPAPEYPFWVDWVSRLLVNEQLAEHLGTQMDALEAMGSTAEERRRRVFQSGLRIHTTLDPELQELAEDTIRRHLTYENEPPEEVAEEPMGSIVSVEPSTGAIRAMAIGPHTYGSCIEDDSWVGETDDGRLLCDRTKVNPAVRGVGGSGRQPGSSFKPFLTAAAIEAGVSPGLTLDARGPQNIDGCSDGQAGSVYTVRNSGGDGVHNMYSAIAASSNVYHALLVAEVGPEKLVDMAHRLGITSPLNPFCSLALGAADVTPLEMASAYATLANRGVYCAPFPITRIEDSVGRVLWEHTPDCRQVIDVEVADRVVHILAGPVASGTATGARLGDWPARGKTGTTNDYVDAWFVGFVRQLATAAWVGYPNGPRHYVDEETAEEVCGSQRLLNECPPVRKLLQNVTIAGRSYARIFGSTIPVPMWATYMRQAVERFEPESFPNPPPIPAAQVPDLLGLASVEDAEDRARQAGFRLVVEEVEDWRPEGTFLSQSPEPGERMALGNRITLFVSDGSGARPALPDVVGMPLSAAAETLSELGYRLGRRNVAVADPELEGIVLAQDPPAGELVMPEDVPMIVLDIGVYVRPQGPADGEVPDGDGTPGDDGEPDDGDIGGVAEHGDGAD